MELARSNVNMCALAYVNPSFPFKLICIVFMYEYL